MAQARSGSSGAPGTSSVSRAWAMAGSTPSFRTLVLRISCTSRSQRRGSAPPISTRRESPSITVIRSANPLAAMQRRAMGTMLAFISMV